MVSLGLRLPQHSAVHYHNDHDHRIYIEQSPKRSVMDEARAESQGCFLPCVVGMSAADLDQRVKAELLVEPWDEGSHCPGPSTG